MARKAFPFVDDLFDRSEYQNEVIPTADNPKMPLSPAKPTVGDSYTRSGQKFAERFAEAHNIGCPAAEHITPDDVPTGLVRLFEAADAAPNANVTNLSQGSIKSLSTGLGDVLYVEVELSPLALCPDPMNGRTIVSARAHHHANLVAVDDHRLGVPVFEVGSASELMSLVAESRSELGFNQPVVAPGKDYQDLISVGLQGVHEPLLATPTMYRTANGEYTFVIKLDDGNRRQAMTQRVLLEATGQTSWAAVSAWDDHLHQTDGTAALHPIEVADVNAVRTKGLFNDFAGGVMYPSSGRDDDVAFFLSNNAARSIRLRTLLRCRTVRVRLVLGVNTATLAPEARSAPSPTATLVSEVVRRLHILEAAQKPWSPETQNLQCGLLALSNARKKLDSGADDAPLTSAETTIVIDNSATDWAGANDGPRHPLRLATKAIAMLVCDQHDGTQAVREAMRSFNMSVHYSHLAENRAKIAAESVMAILGFSHAESRSYDRARTVIDRVIRTRLFTDVKSHPDSLKRPWWTLLNEPIDDLVKLAKTEVAAIAALSAEDRNSRGNGTGPHGPATRALLLFALVAQTTSPAVVPHAGKLGASPFQLTLNGLGGTRGLTKTTPDQVLLKLCGDQMGIDQLGEIVRAAIEPTPRLPQNVIDPEAEDPKDPSTVGLLTESFLRGTAMGWTESGDTGSSGIGAAATHDIREQYRLVVSIVIERIQQAFDASRQLVEECDGVLDGETLHTLFEENGIRSNPAEPVQHWLSELQRVFFAGEAYAKSPK